jgi:hypothetical protein
MVKDLHRSQGKEVEEEVRLPLHRCSQSRTAPELSESDPAAPAVSKIPSEMNKIPIEFTL